MVLLSSGWFIKKTVGNHGERVNIRRAKHIERMNRTIDFGSLEKMEPVMMVYMNDLDPTILKIEM